MAINKKSGEHSNKENDENEEEIEKREAAHWDKIFEREFKKESDRASVILSVAMLDRALETCLKASLVPIGSSEDDLLEGIYAPISTFSARIDLAHRIGLISAKFCRDLHIIRKIRNEFAHNISGCDFDNSAVRSRITELARSSGIEDRVPKKRRVFPKGPRGSFQMAVSWMLWRLWGLSEDATAIEPAELEWGYTEFSDNEGKK